MIMGVLTLQELCLFPIRDMVESGQCPPTRFLPPTLRQRIFETIYKDGTIDNPKCIDVLGAAEYLQDFARINTQKGRTDDNAFLEKVATSIGQLDPNTKMSIGDGIEELDLHIYNGKTETDASYNNAVRLISKCPNLKTLNVNLDGPKTYPYIKRVWPLLNRSADNDQCRSVLENINKLSIVVPNKHWRPCYALRNDAPLLEFRDLTSLKLETCDVNPFAWRKLLESTQNTLRILSVVNVEAINDQKRHRECWILPISMPQLTDFEYLSSFPCTVPATQLLTCDALLRVHVETYVDDDLTEDRVEGLSSIQQLVASLELSVTFGTDNEIAARFFDQLGHSVKSLIVTGDNYVRKIAAISRCPNLEQLEWYPGDEGNADFSSLADLFRDHVRAEKLRKLSVRGLQSCSVFDVLFENCRYLQILSMNRCSELTDRHLIDLVGHCEVLEKLGIVDCDNVGDAGLTAILIARGSRLVEFVAHHVERMTYKTWKTLFDRCPNVAKISEISYTLEKARKKKSFYQFVDEVIFIDYTDLVELV